MSYSIKLTPIAQEDMKRLPKEAAVFVWSELERLADAPVAMSENSYFPYPPNVQLFRFARQPDADHKELFCVLFKYGSDEQTIHIIGLTYKEVAWWWGKD